MKTIVLNISNYTSGSLCFAYSFFGEMLNKLEMFEKTNNLVRSIPESKTGCMKVGPPCIEIDYRQNIIGSTLPTSSKSVSTSGKWRPFYFNMG